MVDERFCRTAMLLGEEAVFTLQKSRVMLVGLGGVGGYTCEALVRAGIGELILVDFDTVSRSNINRQILADDTTVGRRKTAVAAERIARISPATRVYPVEQFVDTDNAEELILTTAPHYIIDAIDHVPGKLAIIRAAHKHHIPVISCMGTGNKLYPEKLQIGDIAKTHTCPLARTMRAKLRREGIDHLDVLWSSEQPRTPVIPTMEEGRTIPASVSFVPAAAGLMLGGYVVRRLLKID
ncbi:MAG: tRNA threonylcarbamoyladenosine dehydratase [Clostridia bacterium]|nr:tRNA threonylcarbamoyladenosine dehydratase [Clostridia bacterium]